MITPRKSINANRFWDLYFRNAFVTLERHQDRYAGLVYNQPEEAQPPGGLVRDLVKEPFEISLATLREYGYEADPRFALIRQYSADLNVTFGSIVEQTYPYREPAPFGKQRMSELFAQIRSLLMRQASEMTIADLQDILKNMVEHHSSELNQPIAALSWFLGERRKRSSSAALLLVIQNSSIAPFARHQVHFTGVDAAFSALWKVNDKTCLWNLLEIMRHTSESGWRKIAPLFARLLSTNELLSLERLDSSYFDPDSWARMLEPYRTFTAEEWDHFDADSLFWEIRYVAATRSTSLDVKSLDKLATDEVAIVCEAARARR